MITGNTVRLDAYFTDWEGDACDPTGIELRVYDNDHKLVGVKIDITGTHKIGTGHYRYDYAIPEGNDDLYFEFKGTSGGSTILGRTRMAREFYS